MYFLANKMDGGLFACSSLLLAKLLGMYVRLSLSLGPRTRLLHTAQSLLALLAVSV